MPEFSPTKEQQSAIEARDSGILVSAAAGSGKTKVLTERLMGYLTETPPKSIDSFLVITFTRAAAGELRSRIMDELTKRMAAEPGNTALRRQYALVGRAQIGTIHGFCANLLRDHCLPLGLTPDFKIMEQDRADTMKRVSLTRVLESCYERIGTDGDFRLLADTVGAGRDDARLEALILNLHGKMQCHPDPSAWAASQREGLYANGITDAGETLWGRYLLDTDAQDADYWANRMDSLLALMAQPEYDYIGKKYAASIAETADGLRAFAISARQGWDQAAQRADIPFPRLGSLRDPKDLAVVDSVKALRDACKKACSKFKADFAEPSEKVLTDMRKTAPAMEALLRVTLEFDAAYAADKRRRGLVDYADLEHFAAKLLANADGTPTPLALELREQYTEIMVDEYQDVNAVQELIFQCVSRDGTNLFTVGDVKQSIYRFRLADPSIFTHKYLTYSDYGDAVPAGTPRRILLQENFRSRREVLDAANAVFENIMSVRLGELDYDKNARLRYGAFYDGQVPCPTLYLVNQPDVGDDEESPDKHASEAAFVARRIRELVDSGTLVTDGNLRRPVKYGDIALLMRSANTVSAIYRRELALQGIPVQSEQGSGYYETPEISLMMSLLAIIDNPRQDVPLIAVLRSPYLGFTPDDLAQIRAAGKRMSFYDALCLRAESDETCRRFLTQLVTFRRAAPNLPLSELIWRVYNDLDILTISSAMEDGQARRDNLMVLIQLAAQFEAAQYRGLRQFVLWLNRQAQSGQEPAVSHGESGDAVHLMSIHRSKGLEFPVVFLCDTARRFNQADTMSTVLVHPQLGLGPKVTDTVRGIEFYSMPRRAIARRMTRETLSEEMRLLYVAMTRAKERLFITAVLPDGRKKVDSIWPLVTSPMSPQILSSQSAPVDWLISAALADGEAHLRIEHRVPDAAAPLISAAEEESETVGDSALSHEIRRNLSYVYPHRAAQDIPSKLTATELKHIGELPDEDAASLLPPAKRRFREFRSADKNAPLSPAERGTAVHLVFQHIDVSRTETPEQVRRELERLQNGGYLTSRQAQCADVRQIYEFFASPVGQCIRNGDSVLREFKFSLLRPASAYFPAADGDSLLLQGVIDCAVEKNGAYTIIDYKTDHVTGAAVQQRAELYRSQVNAYAEALTEITGKPVEKRILYFLHPGTSIEL